MTTTVPTRLRPGTRRRLRPIMDALGKRATYDDAVSYLLDEVRARPVAELPGPRRREAHEVLA